LDQERNMGGLVTYLRVSTSQQGKSGLGIEAQREALARFAQAEGLDIVAEHLEVETGKGSDVLDRRPRDEMNVPAQAVELGDCHRTTVAARLG
jgi:DNA invertase Pin-like site-specific DNA recombinase